MRAVYCTCLLPVMVVPLDMKGSDVRWGAAAPGAIRQEQTN